MITTDSQADPASAHCAVCGGPIDFSEQRVALAGGAFAHGNCAGADTKGVVAQPPCVRPPRRQPDRLAHTSFPKRSHS